MEIKNQVVNGKPLKVQGNPLNPEQAQIAEIIYDFVHDPIFGSDDHFFCTPETWEERGEDFGQGAELIVVFDGSVLFDILNYYPSLAEKLHNSLKSQGYFLELGYSWSASIHKI
jgi:hypothetical protein